MSEAGSKVGGRACVLRAGGFSCVLVRACVDAFVGGTRALHRMQKIQRIESECLPL